jgi:drug/metabolite transporter (DMT)-like permease
VPPKPTRANWLAIISLGLIWGGTFMVVSLALRGYGPFTVACARTTLGALALFSLMIVLRRPFPSRDALIATAMIGPLNTAIPFALLAWGQQFVPSAFAGISMAVLPLLILPLAHLFSDEKMSLPKLYGVCLGFVGAVILIGASAFQIGQGSNALGQLACLGATLCYAISSIFTRRCPPIDSIALAAFTLVFGAIWIIPAMLWIEGVPKVTDFNSSVAILFLGFVPTALAAYLRVSVVRTAGSVFMTNVNYQVPLWSVLFGTLILGETLPWRFFAALGLILCGLVISQGKNPIRILVNRA